MCTLKFTLSNLVRFNAVVTRGRLISARLRTFLEKYFVARARALTRLRKYVYLTNGVPVGLIIYLLRYIDINNSGFN
jgi:hypothetical protein